MLKKMFLTFLSVFIILGLVACGQAGPANDSSGSGELVDDEDELVQDEKTEYKNDAFKNITFTDDIDQVILSGDVKVFEGVFQFAIMDPSGETLMEGDYQADGAPSWGTFEIAVDKSDISDGTFLKLFAYSAEDGSEINVLEIPF